MNEQKNKYFRKLVAGSYEDSKEKVIQTFDKMEQWEYDGIKNDGAIRHVIKNEQIGAQVIFLEEDNGLFFCNSVQPIDCQNIDSEDYHKGFDAAKNQAGTIQEDVLYHLCLCFNEASRKDNLDAWCAIIPSLYDISRKQ